MKENYIFEIIKQFFRYSYPPETEERIQKWIVRDEWTAEKNDALSAVWDEIELSPNGDTYKTLAKVKSRIRQIENRKNQLRMRRVLLGSAAILIPILLLLGGYLYVHRNVEMIEVLTTANQQKQCILSDGTIIWMNACTRLTYPSRFDDSIRVVTLEGEAYFTVKSDAAKPFIVKTNELTVKVLGTKFNVSAYPSDDRAVATLNSGKIQVDVHSGKADGRYLLQPDQKIVLNKADHSVSIHDVEAGSTGWKDGTLVFEDATFNDIVHTIERRYGVTIDYDKEAFMASSYTVKFVHNESLEDILGILQDVAGAFEYKIENNKITLMQKGGNN